MLLAVCLSSTYPLIFGIQQAQDNPYLFRAIVALGACIGSTLLAFYYIRHINFYKTLITLIYNNQFWRQLGIATINRFNFVCYTYSLLYIDIAIATIVAGTWPMFAVLILTAIFKQKFTRITPAAIALLIAGFIGIAVVTLGSVTDISTLNPQNASELAVGLTIGLIGAALSALTVYELKLCQQLISHLNTHPPHTNSIPTTLKPIHITIVTILIVNALFNAVTVITQTGMAVVTSEQPPIPDPTLIIVALSAGGVIMVAQSLIRRYALLMSSNYSLDALNYFSPLFALLWIAILSLSAVQRPSYVVTGALIIIAANVLLQSQTHLKPKR